MLRPSFQNVVVNETSSSVEVVWQALNTSSGSDSYLYRLEDSLDNFSPVWNAIVNRYNGLSKFVDGLSTGSTYLFRTTAQVITTT